MVGDRQPSGSAALALHGWRFKRRLGRRRLCVRGRFFQFNRELQRLDVEQRVEFAIQPSNFSRFRVGLGGRVGNGKLHLKPRRSVLPLQRLDMGLEQQCIDSACRTLLWRRGDEWRPVDYRDD